MHKNPYIVVGTGRSGTSFVADILHNDMGVCMGKEFPPANESNPDGFWEDIDFYNLNTQLVSGDINFPDFLKRLLAVVKERQDMGIPWGFKESRMGVLLGIYLALFESPRVIWTQRDADLTVASLERWYGYDLQKAREFYRARMLMIDRIIRGKNPLVIYFGKERVGRGEIITAIGEKWEKKT